MASIEVPRVAPGVKWLLIACVGGYVLQMMPGIGPFVELWGALIPSRVFEHGEIWRLVTYMFLHGGMAHLLFNMLGLWMFSADLEGQWGTKRFLTFYFVCGIGAAFFSAFMWNQPIIGASGAIFGLFLAFGMLYPDRTVLLFFVVPVPARIAVFVLFLLTFLLDVGQSVAHVTHLGGIVVGLAFLKLAPRVDAWLLHRGELREERERRTRAESYYARERYFAEVIDPILKKISAGGMGSLSGKEKSLLKKVARTDQDRLKRSKVIPFDLFK
jgi:membrane associated rhomboid family serine protease